jgi:glutamate carboxypeptidase
MGTTPSSVDLHGLLARCEALRDWQLELIETLARAESPSEDRAGLNRCGSLLANAFAGLGARVERVPAAPAGDHVLAQFGSGEPRTLILGHFDTVWPMGTLATMPVARVEGRLHGPGVYDMKAGLGIGLLALRALIEGSALTGTVVFLCTTDEEVGSHTSRALIEDEARRAQAVLVLEPSLAGGNLKTSRKGVGEFRIDLTGIESHAGLDPASGASAVRELARQVLALETLANPAAGTTINVGVVGGGTRSNVVAGSAHGLIDVRVTSMAEASRIEAALRSLAPLDPRVTLRVTGSVARPPLERSPGVLDLYRQAQHVAERLGWTIGEGAAGGASDGNFTAALGVPTLDGLGAIGDGAHARHEHVVIDTLPARSALVAGLVARLSRGHEAEA